MVFVAWVSSWVPYSGDCPAACCLEVSTQAPQSIVSSTLSYFERVKKKVSEEIFICKQFEQLVIFISNGMDVIPLVVGWEVLSMPTCYIQEHYTFPAMKRGPKSSHKTSMLVHGQLPFPYTNCLLSPLHILSFSTIFWLDFQFRGEISCCSSEDIFHLPLPHVFTNSNKIEN